MAYSKAIFRIDLVSGSDTARSTLASCNMTNSSGVVTVAKVGHGLVNGAVVTVPTGTYSGDWLVKRTDDDNFTLHTAHATGVITISGTPIADETFVVGSQTFTFKASRSGAGEVTIGADVYETADNIAYAINTDIGGTSSNYMAFVTDVTSPHTEVTPPYTNFIEKVVVYYITPGTSGNSITFTESATNITVDGSGTLTGGADSTYSDDRSGVDITPFGGMSWTDAWLTTNSGCTTARLAPGDRVAISKTSDPTSLGQTATWTLQSQDVVLTTAVNAEVNQAVGNTWTVSANVTGTTSTNRKLGATCQQLQIAAAFTTGKIAYKEITETDFSSYQQISFWFLASTTLANDVLRLSLCSDTTGDTPVDTFIIPAYPAVNVFMSVVVNKGSALGSSIKSVALYANSDPGTVNILLNNIVVCKSTASADAITHRSVIGKNDGKWYGIQSIVGTTLKIDSGNNSAGGRGYYGTTETVTTYKAEGIASSSAAANTAVNSFPEAGTSSLYLCYDCGWNTSTNVVDGKSRFSGINFLGACVVHKNYNIVQNIEGYGFYYGTYTAAIPWVLKNSCFSNCSPGDAWGATLSLTHSSVVIKVNALNGNRFGVIGYNGAPMAQVIKCNFENNTNVGIYFSSLSYYIDCNSYNSGSHGIYDVLYGVAMPNFYIRCKSKYNNGYGFYSSFGNFMFPKAVQYLETSNNVSGGVYQSSGAPGRGRGFLNNCTISDTTEVAFGNNDYWSYVYSYNHDNSTDNHIIFQFLTTHVLQTATQGGSGKEWKTTIANSNPYFRYLVNLTQAKLEIARFAVKASKLVTLTLYCTKNHATNTGARLVVENQPGVLSTDEIVYKDNNTNREQLTITFTPTGAGVLRLIAETWLEAIATNYTTISYWDTISISQAD